MRLRPERSVLYGARCRTLDVEEYRGQVPGHSSAVEIGRSRRFSFFWRFWAERR
jgi:hypothetical protein